MFANAVFSQTLPRNALHRYLPVISSGRRDACTTDPDQHHTGCYKCSKRRSPESHRDARIHALGSCSLEMCRDIAPSHFMRSLHGSTCAQLAAEFFDVAKAYWHTPWPEQHHGTLFSLRSGGTPGLVDGALSDSGCPTGPAVVRQEHLTQVPWFRHMPRTSKSQHAARTLAYESATCAELDLRCMRPSKHAKNLGSKRCAHTAFSRSNGTTLLSTPSTVSANAACQKLPRHQPRRTSTISLAHVRRSKSKL